MTDQEIRDTLRGMLADWNAATDEQRAQALEEADRAAAAAQRLGAYRSAVAHPFHVHTFASWADHDGLVVGFQTELEARAFAAGRPEPLVDLVARGRGVIASRRLVAHPAAGDRGFVQVDDFPQDPDELEHAAGAHDVEAVPGCGRCDELMA